MSYIKDTHIGELINRAVDGWGKILGLTESNKKKCCGGKCTKKTKGFVKKKVKK
jgi:hypothetical protein